MSKDAIRKHILWTAMEEVKNGSHYLTGCDGGIPQPDGGSCGGLDGRSIRLVNVQEKDAVAIFAARFGSGPYCQGRYDAVPGGRKIDVPKTKDLCSHLQTYCPEGSWGKGLTPRSLNYETVILGENCSGKRHFDCIWFVNWVLTTALKKPKIQLGFEQWIKGNGVCTLLEESDKKAGGIKDGDIFINMNSKPKHIGFLTADGRTVHASSPANGVVVGAWKLSDYTHIVRLKDSYLNFG